MTSQPAYPGYATPNFIAGGDHWAVGAHPWELFIGTVHDFGAVGWTAISHKGARVGLFPTQQAAGEALVRHAGYEVLR